MPPLGAWYARQCPTLAAGQAGRGSHVLAELDFEEGATWDDLVLTTPELVRHTDSIGIQSPVLYGPPIGKNRAAAM